MGTDFAAIAGLLGHPARSAMIDALMDGRALPASELAGLAGVCASTASEHLGRLVDGGLVAVTPQGRHRFFRISTTDVAVALEAFAQICPPAPVRSLRTSIEAEAIRYARTCYDHLAGSLGVGVVDAMRRRRWLAPADGGYRLSRSGELALEAVGVDVAAAAGRRRTFARPCIDWTERRPHLAGALGAALTTTMLDRDWIRRRDGRGVIPTDAGRIALREVFGVSPAVLGEALAPEAPPDAG
ncbi:MAG: ArsR/SmtB family transcription factor [Acidimicrobiales bacterium]